MNKDGKWFLCGTSPEMYGQRTTRRIRGGYDMIHLVPKLPCEERGVKESRFRTYDGTCNAPEDQGATFSVLKRYEDGPRRWDQRGRDLPNPRLVSREVHKTTSKPSKNTLLLMQIGQLSDHDFSVVPLPTETDDTIRCCGVPKEEWHEACFPIPIPPGDHHFKDCMEFTRSESVHLTDGTLVLPRLRDNAITSFLDASFLYGSDRMKALELRTEEGAGAFLKTSIFKGKVRLPEGDPMDCINDRPGDYCPLCGDARCGEQPGLTAIHTVYVKEHNRQVKRLVRALLADAEGHNRPEDIKDVEVDSFIEKADNHTKELLYQVTRKIVGAVWQNMMFSEYIPLIIGPRFMDKYYLWPGRRVKYNPRVNPSMTEEFSGAAYRYGHTLINDMMFTGEMHRLKDLFGVSYHTLDNYEKIVLGLVGLDTMVKSESFDSNIATSIVDHLFENDPGHAVGFDLMALNIQRGRDHGLPPFNKLRKFFRWRPFRYFAQFGDCGRSLRKVYRHPDDVDLFTGGVCEKSVPDGVVGTVFAEIIGRQMYELKYGDLYYFETESKFFGFTNAQLGSLRQERLSKVLCENADIEAIQWNPFYPPNYYYNPLIDCKRLRDVDMGPFLSYFKEY
ncbi:hypothetical protein BaRGS_00012092 [Batillaria attramentaria]|uniref:Uncharacterized protein n=1 Tax=Batillaria attramentaria TaxID=370345 RepID=A0ABD0LBG5_9CAEN